MVICEKCGTELHIGDFPFCHGDPEAHVQAVNGVIRDDIPGGILIKNAICHPDGSPKRYYSLSDIIREDA